MTKPRYKELMKHKPKVTWTSEEGLEAFIKHIKRKLETYKKAHPERDNEQREVVVILTALIDESDQYKAI